MQYHYTVAYDAVEKRWFIEADPSSFYPDGNVWDEVQCNEEGNGWLVPEWDSPEEAFDMECYKALESVIGTLPHPKVG